ncbi:hypothetical protein [Chryseobacterium sp. MFBS3-17]|uniref:hypothetical protein n=1 Tax=Chryseobacterium sp. MFBS3-17 TaxID=2886689 RepID=UPI001D0E91E7|nr:hypothetical protein [Chryseobacterium sp. MFBS3-17]MCC2590306.1 hypothetical protein [Chryseobacterium sp. MFBS3-17]
MKQHAEEIIKIKVAISLRHLLKQNKEYSQNVGKIDEIINSYEKIAIHSDMRKATVSQAFNGVTRTAMTTIVLIIEAMNFTLVDFSKIYEEISEKQIDDFKKNLDKKV